MCSAQIRTAANRKREDDLETPQRVEQAMPQCQSPPSSLLERKTAKDRFLFLQDTFLLTSSRKSCLRKRLSKLRTDVLFGRDGRRGRLQFVQNISILMKVPATLILGSESTRNS